MIYDDDRYTQADYDRDEAAAEAKWERQQRRRHTACQCGTDLPGTCPGPMNCPMVGDDGDDGDEEGEDE